MKRKLFLLFSALFLWSSYLWLAEEVNPAWMEYQRTYYAEQLVLAQKQLGAATEETDEKERAQLEENVAKFSNPKYAIKQVLLKGTATWAQQRNGDKVDRCLTCHMDERKLGVSHRIVKEFPFDVYGCTVCHKGEGRALSKEDAHHGMLPYRRQMQERLENSDAVFALWLEFTELSPEETDPNLTPVWGNFRHLTVTGEHAIFTGSKKCLRCHAGLTAPHVERWKRTKFTSFERVKKAPDFVDGNEEYRKKCYKCHTTGYNTKTGKYEETGVTCEACHGPGELYGYFMDIGKAQEGQKIARVNSPYNVCFDCHISRRHEMRPAYFEERDTSGNWWFSEYSKLLTDSENISPSEAWLRE
ncbi:MAG: multiheme c-type cytochrome [Candidatus Brocadiales bacterium]